MRRGGGGGVVDGDDEIIGRVGSWSVLVVLGAPSDGGGGEAPELESGGGEIGFRSVCIDAATSSAASMSESECCPLSTTDDCCSFTSASPEVSIPSSSPGSPVGPSLNSHNNPLKSVSLKTHTALLIASSSPSTIVPSVKCNVPGARCAASGMIFKLSSSSAFFPSSPWPAATSSAAASPSAIRCARSLSSLITSLGRGGLGAVVMFWKSATDFASWGREVAETRGRERKWVGLQCLSLD